MEEEVMGIIQMKLYPFCTQTSRQALSSTGTHRQPSLKSLDFLTMNGGK